MASKPIFSEPQIRILRDTAKKLRKRFRTQEEMALALGITQPSLSALLSGRWAPGLTTARAIAQLEGITLENLIGPFGDEVATAQPVQQPGRFPGLEACLTFYAGTKSWAPWTVAAARAGLFGEDDLPPPAWPERLDAAEAALSRLRK